MSELPDTAWPNGARPLLVALTGGIASGKSTVAGLFAKRQVPVLDTDQIARAVVEPGTPILSRLVTEFGAEILDGAGALDRPRMRQRIFADAAVRQQLEAILHPAIRAELGRRAAVAGGLYQIHVIPLLVESATRDRYDRTLVVDCTEEQQIRRLMQRDQATIEQARNMLGAQATRAQRLSVADDVIANTGTYEELARYVEPLHRNYVLLARSLFG